MTIVRILIKYMLLYISLAIAALIAFLLAFIALKIDWQKLKDLKYVEITLFLAAGGHTGELS